MSRQHQTSNGNDREHVLGRRVIIDPSQALGGGEFAPAITKKNETLNSNGTGTNGLGVKTTRTSYQPLAPNRANSMRSLSAPKPPERKNSSSSSSGSSGDFPRKAPFAKPMRALPKTSSESMVNQHRTVNSTYKYRNGSNLSLSSIISHGDSEMLRTNSLFDDLLSSFEDETNSTSTLPSLISMIRNENSSPFASSGPQTNGGVNGHQQRNGRIDHSDDEAELSSSESVKRQECGGKLSADSAYSRYFIKSKLF